MRSTMERMKSVTHVAGVVDVAAHVALAGAINNLVIVDLEHIAADLAVLFVAALPDVSHFLSDDVTKVLHDHGVGGHVLAGEEAPVVDLAVAYLGPQLPELRGEGEEKERRPRKRRKRNTPT